MLKRWNVCSSGLCQAAQIFRQKHPFFIVPASRDCIRQSTTKDAKGAGTRRFVIRCVRISGSLSSRSARFCMTTSISGLSLSEIGCDSVKSSHSTIPNPNIYFITTNKLVQNGNLETIKELRANWIVKTICWTILPSMLRLEHVQLPHARQTHIHTNAHTHTHTLTNKNIHASNLTLSVKKRIIQN